MGVSIGPWTDPVVSLGDFVRVEWHMGASGAYSFVSDISLRDASGDLLAWIAHSVSAPNAPPEIAVELGTALCAWDDGYCTWEAHALEMSAGGEQATVDPGTKARVGAFEVRAGAAYTLPEFCVDGDWNVALGVFRTAP